MTWKRFFPAAHLQSSHGTTVFASRCSVAAPPACTSKQGTHSEVRDVAIGRFMGGTQLSFGSYHDTAGRCSDVLPEVLLWTASSMLSLCELKKYAFYNLFSPPSTHAHLCSILYTMNLSGLHKEPHTCSAQ